MDLADLLRTLRNGAADGGDFETAYRHESRLQILLGVPASFTGKYRNECAVCASAPCVCPDEDELLEDGSEDGIDAEALSLSPFMVEMPDEGVTRG